MTDFIEIDFLEAGDKGSGDAIAIRHRTRTNLDWIYVVDGGYADDGQKARRSHPRVLRQTRATSTMWYSHIRTRITRRGSRQCSTNSTSVACG